jgi:hypothetical protein
MASNDNMIGPHGYHQLDDCCQQLAEYRRQLDEASEVNRSSIRAAIQALEEAISRGKSGR